MKRCSPQHSQSHEPTEDFVHRRPGKQTHTYRDHRGPRWRGPILLVCAILFIFCGIQLVAYFADAWKTQQASDTMRSLYHADSEPTKMPEATITATVAVTIAPTVTPAPAFTTSPTATPNLRLEIVPYPDGSANAAGSRFTQLRQQNKDIIGWLTIEGMLDEAVVQADNVTYLNRDALRNHNVNGAIFLDEICDLTTRPYTLFLYGHNMKTGLMFGGLRNYENLTYYKNNPFINFDTVYEAGRYVIFAVETVSIDPDSLFYVDFTALNSLELVQREAALQELMQQSVYRCTVDVQPQDQLLLLITCVGEEDERRVVAARRLREGETEDDVWELVRKTRERK